MEDERERLLYCATALLLIKNKKKEVWVKDWLQTREDKGSFANICKELTMSKDEKDFRLYVRMPVPQFYKLLDKISPLIAKEDTRFRQAISVGSKLEATLRFLATGDSYVSFKYSTRISRHSLGIIIPETCQAIYQVLRGEYLKMSFGGE